MNSSIGIEDEGPTGHSPAPHRPGWTHLRPPPNRIEASPVRDLPLLLRPLGRARPIRQSHFPSNGAGALKAAAMPRAVAPRSSVTASPCRFAELPPRGSSYPSWEASNPSERRGHGGAKEPPPRGRRGRTSGQRHWCVGRVSNHPSDVRRRRPPKLQTLAEGARAEGPWRSRQGKGRNDLCDLQS
jgi:hypothetical protein